MVCLAALLALALLLASPALGQEDPSLVLVTWISNRRGGEIWVNGVKVCESSEFEFKCPVYVEGLDAWEGLVTLIPDPGWMVMGAGGYAYVRGDVDPDPDEWGKWVVTIPAGQPDQDRFVTLHAQFRRLPGAIFIDGFESGDTLRWSDEWW